MESSTPSIIATATPRVRTTSLLDRMLYSRWYLEAAQVPTNARPTTHQSFRGLVTLSPCSMDRMAVQSDAATACKSRSRCHCPGDGRRATFILCGCSHAAWTLEICTATAFGLLGVLGR